MEPSSSTLFSPFLFHLISLKHVVLPLLFFPPPTFLFLYLLLLSLYTFSFSFPINTTPFATLLNRTNTMFTLPLFPDRKRLAFIWCFLALYRRFPSQKIVHIPMTGLRSVLEGTCLLPVRHSCPQISLAFLVARLLLFIRRFVNMQQNRKCLLR